MDQTVVTPNKATTSSTETSPISPVMYKTPLKECSTRITHASYQGSVGTFSVLANHITPPSGLTKFIARNPFDAELSSRLHLSVMSPSLFTKVSPMSHDSPFAWTIDEIANLRPAEIEEFPMQQAHSYDPENESKTQEVIKNFFSDENQIHPSPWNDKREPARPLLAATPTRSIEAFSAKGETQKTAKDCWSQTELSFPPVLPQHIEDALKPYLTFTQDQQVDNEDANSSNNSLRRKLFFNHDESTEDEEEYSRILSPVKDHSSPPQCGMFVHGTPLRRGSMGMQRTFGTPHNSRNMSPPDMSPICIPAGDMSFHTSRSRCRSRNATRLDFSAHMSVDTSLVDDKEVEKLQLPDNNEDVPTQEVGVDMKTDYLSECEQNETIEMVSLLQENTPIKSSLKNNEIIDKLKDAVDWYKAVSSESINKIPPNLTLAGISEQSSAFNAQDTGYQTYSMNNTTANPDSRNITPIKKLYRWNERINEVPNTEEMTISDWQENLKTMFSSTPSKLIRHRDN